MIESSEEKFRINKFNLQNTHCCEVIILLYDYDKPDMKKMEVLSKEKCEMYTVEHITFPSPYPTNVLEAKKVHVFLHTPNEVRGKVLFLHGLGDRNVDYLLWFAKYFALHGLATAFMVLPYNHLRASKTYPAGLYYMEADTAKAVERFRHAVMDARSTLDFLDLRLPSFKKTHVMGVSFGGMISTITAGVDTRVDKLSLVITGGNFRYINWLSPLTESVREKYKHGENHDGCGTLKKCILAHANYMDFVRSIRTQEDVYKAPWRCFTYDPIPFAPLFKGEVIMFKAAFDKIMPAPSTLQLWEAFGRPKMYVVPSGHFYSIVFKRSIARKTLRFFFKVSKKSDS